MRAELGESDRRTERLAEDGGRRLGEAGVRAWKRNDVHATVNLLGRATSLLPPGDESRRELLCELGIALRATGDPVAAESVLVDAIAISREARDRRVELRALIESAYVRLLHEPGATADALLDAATEAIPIFETLQDNRALGRAWLLAGFVHGHRGRYREWEDVAERALVYYRNAAWPTSTCLGEIAYSLYYGPTPVPEAIARCEALLRDEVTDRVGSANVLVFLGGLFAQQGNFDEAHDVIASASTTYEDLGQRTAVAYYSGAVLGDVALLAGNAVAAQRILTEVCDQLERTHDWSHLASRAGDLAEALYLQDRLDQAEEWTRVAEAQGARDDVDASMIWHPVRAKILARRGAFEVAERLAREGVRLAGTTDAINRYAKAQQDLGEVLRLAGSMVDAGSAFEQAIELYEQKGNLVGAAQVRSLRDDLALV